MILIVGLFASQLISVLFFADRIDDVLIRLAVVVVLALVVTRLMTRSLARVSEAAEELGRDIRRAPMPETGPTEVRKVARAFNEMQSRLMRLVDDRTRILAAVSHDLRTPLTRLRLRLEMLESTAARERSIQDVEDMQAMVSEILEFLEDSYQPESLERVDPVAMLRAICADAPWGEASVSINGSARALLARPLALKRCLTNLVENAVRYGGHATITFDDRPERVGISIRDNGPGIPAESLERVFDPFYRVESSRNRDSGGTGLGLTIAHEVAVSHGGNLTLSNLPGGGLEALLTLPRPG